MLSFARHSLAEHALDGRRVPPLDGAERRRLFVHDSIESFHPEGAYAASVVLAGMSFILLVGMEAFRKRVAAREGRPDE